MDALLSSPEVGISTMRLTLVQASDEDKRWTRREPMAMRDYHVQLNVFSLIFLMRREEEGLEFARDALLTLA